MFIYSTRYFWQILIRLDCSRQIFEKCPDIQLHENPSTGSWVVPCGRTDGHDKATIRFSLFCEGAWKVRKIPKCLRWRFIAIVVARLKPEQFWRYQNGDPVNVCVVIAHWTCRVDTNYGITVVVLLWRCLVLIGTTSSAVELNYTNRGFNYAFTPTRLHISLGREWWAV